MYFEYSKFSISPKTHSTILLKPRKQLFDETMMSSLQHEEVLNLSNLLGEQLDFLVIPETSTPTS
jgi:hypothetical protein